MSATGNRRQSAVLLAWALAAVSLIFTSAIASPETSHNRTLEADTLATGSAAQNANVTALAATPTSAPRQRVQPVIVIHGGAGVSKGELTADEEKQCHQTLASALQAGYAVLAHGGHAIDAVEAAVKTMEDSKVFNAGAGAVFNHDGKNELDAAIMDGRTHEAGSVAGVSGIKNPIDAAVAVMRKSGHVMLVADGANKFAQEQKLETKPPEYFYTKKRWEELQKQLQTENRTSGSKQSFELCRRTNHFGTVGAVALDSFGDLAAGTSTGGLTGKRWGRVGDSPIIGAGTFADNESCAVSCTGHGEWFIRFSVASDLCSRVKYRNESVSQAANEIIHGVLGPGHGDGGLIVLDRKGNFACPFNTDGMFRGYMKSADSQPDTAIY